MTEFRLVKATPEDAPQVALIMAEALGDDIMERCLANGNEIPAADRRRMELLRQVALHDDTLYSYRHCTLVRTADGQTAGGLIAYPGDDYESGAVGENGAAACDFLVAEPAAGDTAIHHAKPRELRHNGNIFSLRHARH